MRTGGYTLQQSLTVEAASVIKQAVTLARRRGHSQVTPLHVASVMLASSSCLFRRACLQAHSHPLQCKALELCFNVSLNRLPTSTSSPLLGPHSHLPSLSNALVAAFKRAQAHQRRGSMENQQQQPILALKVEIEQLVISILDDPSVSRVMREAGFSSTQVKSKVEQSISLGIPSIISHPKLESEAKLPLGLGNFIPQTLNSSQFKLSVVRSAEQVTRDDDVMSIVGAMMNKKTKNTIIVGECPSSAESVVKGVIEKFNTGNVPWDMRYVQFISVPLFTLRNISREEFEEKLVELRSLVKSYVSGGVVLYLGDLKWVSEFWSKLYGEQRISHNYSPVEHMIMELSRLLCGINGDSTGKLWIMGTASFNTYMKCKIGRPSLETLWDLHPLTIPVGSLTLSLNLDSDLNNIQMRSKGVVEGSSSWLLSKAGAEKYLTCCADCLANFNKEARNNLETSGSICSSILPSWLQQYKEEKKRETNDINHDDQKFEKIRDLCTKWNSICKSVHKQQPHFLTKLSKCDSPILSPSSSASISSSNDKIIPKWPLIFNHNQSPQEFKTEITKQELLSNPNSSPNSASSSEASGDHMDDLSLNNEALCNALEKKVPWQKESIQEIVSTILQCRSGKSNKKSNIDREETWLNFLGKDIEGKDKVAKELAKVVFGSQENFISIGISSFSSSSSLSKRGEESNEEVISNKRSRDEQGRSYFERFANKVQENPSQVFFLEDFDQIDYHSQKGFKKAIENGSLEIQDYDDELILLKDAIIIFSCDSFMMSSSFSRASSPNGTLDLNVATQDEINGDEDLVSQSGILDLVDKNVMFKVQVL